MNRIISIACLLVVFIAAGCDGSKPTNHDTKATSLGIKANCEVCGDHELDVMSDTPFADFNGKRFYFCSDGCRDDFKKAPEKYAMKKPTTGAAATQPTVN